MIDLKDIKEKEIKEGDLILFSTWGMFGVHKSWWENSERYKIGYIIPKRLEDPEHITHLDHGIVDELLHEEDESLYVRPVGTAGVIHICMKPSWTPYGEFVEVIGRKGDDNKNKVITPLINKDKIMSTIDNAQNHIDVENYDIAITIFEDLKLGMESVIERLKNWKKRKLLTMEGSRTHFRELI